MDIIKNNLLSQISAVSSELPWLDESFKKKFAEIDEQEAFRKLSDEIHSIAEVVSHLVEWRQELVKRFKNGVRSMEVDDERNWIPNEQLAEKGWKSLVDRFYASEIELNNFLKDKTDEFLNTPYYDKSFLYILEGWLHHDLYHLGQIGLLQKLNKVYSLS